MSSSSPYPPLEKALRLIKKEHVENSWCNVTGKVDTVLELLKQAEEEDMEWGKPVYDPLSYTGENPIYYSKEEFIAKHVDPYVDRHKHLEGYIRDYAKTKEFRQKTMDAAAPTNKPGRPRKIDPYKVKELREKGMTQQAIADELGVTKGAISQTLSMFSKDNNVIIAKQLPTENTKPTKQQGNSSEYWTRRTKKKYPDVYERGEVGPGRKYPTARALAIAMGDIIPKVTIQFPPNESGSQIAGRLHQKLNDEQLIELRDALNDFLGEQTNG